MPTNCYKLLRLNIDENDELDFEFVLKMNDPIAVTTNRKVPIRIVEAAFSRFRKDFVFLFAYKKYHQIEIRQVPLCNLIINEEVHRFDNLYTVFDYLGTLPEWFSYTYCCFFKIILCKFFDFNLIFI